MRSSYLKILAFPIYGASLLCILNHCRISPFCSKTEMLETMTPGSPKAEKTEAMDGRLSPRVAEIVPVHPAAMNK